MKQRLLQCIWCVFMMVLPIYTLHGDADINGHNNCIAYITTYGHMYGVLDTHAYTICDTAMRNEALTEDERSYLADVCVNVLEQSKHLFTDEELAAVWHTVKRVLREPREPVNADFVSDDFDNAEDDIHRVETDMVLARDLIFEGGAPSNTVDTSGGIRGRFARISRVGSEDINIAAGDTSARQNGATITSTNASGVNIGAHESRITSGNCGAFTVANQCAEVTVSQDSDGVNIASFRANIDNTNSNGINIASNRTAIRPDPFSDGFNFAATGDEPTASIETGSYSDFAIGNVAYYCNVVIGSGSHVRVTDKDAQSSINIANEGGTITNPGKGFNLAVSGGQIDSSTGAVTLVMAVFAFC